MSDYYQYANGKYNKHKNIMDYMFNGVDASNLLGKFGYVPLYPNHSIQINSSFNVIDVHYKFITVLKSKSGDYFDFIFSHKSIESNSDSIIKVLELFKKECEYNSKTVIPKKLI